MAIQFRADTADGVWRQAAQALLYKQQTLAAESRLGNTCELLHCMLSISNPRSRWIISRNPPINPAFAIVESLWILSGRQDSMLVNYWNPALPRFSGNGNIYHGAYGYRLRNHFQFDQLERAYQTLRNNPTSRQVVLQIWDPRIDTPTVDGLPTAPDIPCNISAMLKIRDGRLEWMQIMRSNDIFRGTPHNIVQFTILQEVIAGWLGIPTGEYVLVTDSLHLYEEDAAFMSITKERSELGECSSLALSKDCFDLVLSEMINSLEYLAHKESKRSELLPLLKNSKLPISYRNLLTVCAADCARRRCWTPEESEAISLCQERTLQVAYSRWASRMA